MKHTQDQIFSALGLNDDLVNQGNLCHFYFHQILERQAGVRVHAQMGREQEIRRGVREDLR